MEDDQAGGEEGFVAVGDFYGCGFAFGVFGAAGEESARDEFVNSAFVVVFECLPRYVVDWVDGRVCLVIVSAAARLVEGAVEQAKERFC